MGSIIDKKKERLSNKKLDRTIKSKGERLGWESLDDEKAIPLREIVGEGRVVNVSYCFMSVSRKAIM